MAAQLHSQRLHRTLHAIAGLTVVLAGLLPGYVLDLSALWLALRKPLIAAGLIIALLGWLTYRPRLARPAAGACAALVFLTLAIAAGEVLFRAIGYDFDRQQAALHRLPPFYRRPTVRTGDVFFRRPGPEVWTGRVINAAVEALHLQTDFYQDEQPLTVRYDAQGFRNDPPLDDWEIAVTGDSFTELGFLPQEQLFTSLLARKLHVRVRNLGVSHTGPLAQLHYLRAYGLAPSLQRVVIAFYEGNDLINLGSEYTRWQRFLATGRRPAGPLHPQTSLLRALAKALVGPGGPPSPPVPVMPDAFLHLGGRTIPVSFDDVPINRDEIAPETETALEGFFRHYAAFARQHNVQPWLLYLPCKLRVWRHRLEFGDQTRVDAADWRPTDLPAHIRRLAEDHDIHFLDVTPALTQETEDSQDLLFNPIVDTHLTAAGAAVVAKELARRMTQAPVPAPAPASPVAPSEPPSPATTRKTR